MARGELIGDRCRRLGQDGNRDVEGTRGGIPATPAKVKVIDCRGAQSFDGAQNLDVRVLISQGEADKRQKLRAS